MKRALITGSSAGIGQALARQWAEQGIAVTGIARRKQQHDFPMQAVQLDLADLDALPTQLKQLPELQQQFDVLVLNAGYGRFGGIESFSYQQMQQLINTNLMSNLYMLKHFLPDFKRRGGVDIVIMGSESALQGARQGAVYCASKFALRGLAQSLQADCAGSDIRVMLINPGPVRSDFFNELHFEPLPEESFALRPEAVAEQISAALQQSRNKELLEVNLQPPKRGFRKK
ncbi:MAG: SDR family oxidoreductase [Gammaproteobacteria bacterium]|nr:SDR family oxidoreductase [Gammaproteobacteria bacterium]